MSIVAIIGEGKLADLVVRQLNGWPQAGSHITNNMTSVLPDTPKASGVTDTPGGGLQVMRLTELNQDVAAASLVLVLEDQEPSAILREAEQWLWDNGIPWLPAYISSGEGIIGPLVRPGQAGCSQCAETRLAIAGRHRKGLDDFFLKLADPDYVTPPPKPLPPEGFLHMAAIIASEATAVVQGACANMEEHLYIINFDQLTTSRHYILPDSQCPICGQLPGDSPEGAVIRLQSCIKIAPGSLRCRPLSTLRQPLYRDYWDRRTGLFNDKHSDLISTFANSAINLPLYLSDELTGGHSHCYRDSELAGILEGLERFSGFSPRGKRTVVFDSYSHLQEAALNPARAGLHSMQQYEQPGFPYEPFDPEATIPWVWGYSFLQERPVLVPELMAYYSMGYAGGFVYESSNGCALGGSLEEAILHGILEVAERDSFLMTWYARLPVPRLDPRSSGDIELTMMTERLETVTGYQVSLFNTTMENGIPSIWAVAKNRGGMEELHLNRSSSSQRVNLVCSAGAHLYPVQAAKNALHELATTISLAEERWQRRSHEALSMYGDSSQVLEMEDHTLVFSLPETEERLHFLLKEDRPLLTFAEAFSPVPLHEDLTDDLNHVLDRFRQLGLEVIVVDQSSKETLRNGLHAVKVLIPGMLPMTFGYRHTRLEGLSRVLDLPQKLGYTNRSLTREELNPYPHPFP